MARDLKAELQAKLLRRTVEKTGWPAWRARIHNARIVAAKKRQP